MKFIFLHAQKGNWFGTLEEAKGQMQMLYRLKQKTSQHRTLLKKPIKLSACQLEPKCLLSSVPRYLLHVKGCSKNTPRQCLFIWISVFTGLWGQEESSSWFQISIFSFSSRCTCDESILATKTHVCASAEIHISLWQLQFHRLHLTKPSCWISINSLFEISGCFIMRHEKLRISKSNLHIYRRHSNFSDIKYILKL